jgi:hypothetical protein
MTTADRGQRWAQHTARPAGRAPVWTPLDPVPAAAAIAEVTTAVEIDGVFASMGIDDAAFYTAEVDDLIAAAER